MSMYKKWEMIIYTQSGSKYLNSISIAVVKIWTKMYS